MGLVLRVIGFWRPLSAHYCYVVISDNRRQENSSPVLRRIRDGGRFEGSLRLRQELLSRIWVAPGLPVFGQASRAYPAHRGGRAKDGRDVGCECCPTFDGATNATYVPLTGGSAAPYMRSVRDFQGGCRGFWEQLLLGHYVRSVVDAGYPHEYEIAPVDARYRHAAVGAHRCSVVVPTRAAEPVRLDTNHSHWGKLHEPQADGNGEHECLIVGQLGGSGAGARGQPLLQLRADAFDQRAEMNPVGV